MKTYKYKSIALLVVLVTLLFSCEDLTQVNENPNGVDPSVASPDLILSTVISQTGQAVVNLGYGDIAGVMQHTQKDGWFSSHNDYDWSDQSWSGYYGILRTNDDLEKKAKALGLEFHEGVSLVIKSYVFGLITDLWGDAPYSQALQGELGGAKNLQPEYDQQKDIYDAILANLDSANTLLSKNPDEYAKFNTTQDVLFNGNVAQWRKFANSLALRYYMRISSKEPDVAQAGIEKIINNPDQYPIITSSADDATMDYPGVSSVDSWPDNTVYDATNGSNYRRIKMCATLVDTMEYFNDPRLGLWAAKVEIPLVVDATLPDGTDKIVDGKRYLSQDIADEYLASNGFPLDTDPDYVGILPSVGPIAPYSYNLNPYPAQAAFNPHVSWLNARYEDASGRLLKSRMMTAAEVHFILAEAALKGWSVGSAEAHYNAAIKASFEAWGIPEDYDDYMAGKAKFNGTLDQLITQKWIASWTAAAESWFDYRRTGFPALKAGMTAKRQALPLRFYYMINEIDLNPVNTETAIQNLQTTQFSGADEGNSAWSKTWLLQGTGEPW